MGNSGFFLLSSNEVIDCVPAHPNIKHPIQVLRGEVSKGLEGLRMRGMTLVTFEDSEGKGKRR